MHTAKSIRDIFDNVSNKYNLMNDAMTLGMHRLWKKYCVSQLHPKIPRILVDLATGTGDIAFKYIACGNGAAIGVDINLSMLQEALNVGKKNGLIYSDRILFLHADATNLPISNDFCDYTTIGFGIRNIPNIRQALSEAYRIIKPGGSFICMEFMKPDANEKKAFFDKLYECYLKYIIPRIGNMISDAGENIYQYLEESIGQFKTENEFYDILTDIGFIDIRMERVVPPVATLYFCTK